MLSEILQLIGNTQVMFLSGLWFRTFAQFLSKMHFSRGAGGSAKCFHWQFQRDGGGGGVLSEISSVVRVWIFSGTTQCSWLTACEIC